MNFPTHLLFLDPVMLVVIQVTAMTGLAILIGSALPMSAANRNCVLFSAFICSFVGPVVLLGSYFTGCAIEFPVFIAESPKRIETLRDEEIERFPQLAQADEAFIEYDRDAVEPSPTTELLPVELEPALIPPPPPEPMSKTPLSLKTVGLIAWIVGASFYLIGIAISMIRLRRLLASVKSIDREKYSLSLARAASNIGLKDYPPIGITEWIEVPAAVGLSRHARVLIPKNYLESMSQTQLVHVLTHEGAHVVRRDPLLKLVQRINLALWWWHPLAYLLNRQLGRAREEICDNFVLRGTNPEEYGETLLQLGKLVSSRNRLVSAVNLFGSRWKLEHRIKGLLNPRRKKMIQVNKSVFTLVLATFVGLTFLVSATRIEAQESREQLERERVQQERREWEFERERFARAEGVKAERADQHQRLEHMMVALDHLRFAGMDELANAVEQRMDKLQAEIRSHDRSARREGEQVEHQRRREEELRAVRDEIEQREQDLQREIQQRERAVRDEIQQRKHEMQREIEQRERALQARENENQEFQQEVMGAIRELNVVVRQLREEVNELKEGDRKEN